MFALTLGKDAPVTHELLGLMYPWGSCLSPICYDSQTNPPFILRDIYRIRLEKV